MSTAAQPLSDMAYCNSETYEGSELRNASAFTVACQAPTSTIFTSLILGCLSRHTPIIHDACSNGKPRGRHETLLQVAYQRLSYRYGPGQWSCQLNVMPMSPLGSPDLSAAFLGDGAQHDLNNGWLFAYQSDIAKFYRNVDGTPIRFSLSPLTGMTSSHVVHRKDVPVWAMG